MITARTTSSRSRAVTFAVCITAVCITVALCGSGWAWEIPMLERDAGSSVRPATTENGDCADCPRHTGGRHEALWVQLVSPNGGEELAMETQVEISWQGSYTGPLDVNLYEGDELVMTLVSLAESSGSFLWEVEDWLGGSPWCRRAPWRVRRAPTMHTSSTSPAACRPAGTSPSTRSIPTRPCRSPSGGRAGRAPR